MNGHVITAAFGHDAEAAIAASAERFSYWNRWGACPGGPAPGLSFQTAGWLQATEIAAVATDTWRVEVRPDEWPGAMQPLHQVELPHIGLLLGETWDLDGLAADCAEDRVYEVFLAARPLPFTCAVGAPVNPVAVD